MANREEDIKLLTEYLLTLLAEQNTKEKNEIIPEFDQEDNKPRFSKAQIAAQKTMKQLNEVYGVEAEVIRQIIVRANELRPNRSDYTIRWDKPLYDEFEDSVD